MDSDIGIILVDHGSRMAEANAMLDEVARAYAEHSGAAIVEPAHMELAEPSIEQAFAKCIERGAKRIVVHPYFLSPGRHSTSDIPRMAAEAASQYPAVDYVVTEPLGLEPAMNTVIQRRVEEGLAKLDEGTNT